MKSWSTSPASTLREERVSASRDLMNFLNACSLGGGLPWLVARYRPYRRASFSRFVCDAGFGLSSRLQPVRRTPHTRRPAQTRKGDIGLPRRAKDLLQFHVLPCEGSCQQ